jgi:hypothetical protein
MAARAPPMLGVELDSKTLLRLVLLVQIQNVSKGIDRIMALYQEVESIIHRQTQARERVGHHTLHTDDHRQVLPIPSQEVVAYNQQEGRLRRV